ncbi:extracellular solute-binding protein [Bradyrhizobium sp. 146]|nr:extracellular solute-binding protein [Bradyrhizobium sp. CW11]MCK1703682.1 extracellular solute-binding protein [Bradyrhizobium sp. 146]
MFAPVDYTLWDQESLEGTPSHARLKDAIVVFQTAGVLAYDERVFPGGGPQNWVDFWDVKKFTGARGLEALLGKHTIPLALLAAGLPHQDIWPLTDDKLDRAFDKLNQIKPYVSKWWSAGGEAPQLLINGEYAMTSAFDGRITAAIRRGAQIKFVWEGAWLSYSYAAILKGGPNTGNAQKAVRILESRADCRRSHSRYWLSRPEHTSTPVSPARVDPPAKYRSEKHFESPSRGQRVARRQAPRWQDKCGLSAGALARVARAIAAPPDIS